MSWRVRFQSTRPRGARRRTRSCATQPAGYTSFNPRARVGRDPADADDVGVEVHVSIHAPAWGATQPRRRPWHCSRCFNPRARVGRDKAVSDVGARAIEFQSTRPRGARHVLITGRVGIGEFQSTRPRGARPSLAARVMFCKWFQSTRPRGARPGVLDAYDLMQVFQSTRPRGARPVMGAKVLHDLRVSIHAPAWGATRRPRCVRPHTGVSIHAPAWGATPSLTAGVTFSPVSIHAPAWGAT